MNTEFNNYKKVIVQISRAENLIPSHEKTFKINKWRVIVTTNKKRYLTDLIGCTDGNPYWNTDLEIKLVKNQIEPIILVIVDAANNQYGQITIQISSIIYKSGANSAIRSSIEPLICTDLTPSKKCPNPIGCLYYKIYAIELYPDETKSSVVNFNKRHSIFGYRFDSKLSRKQSYMESGSQVDINHSVSQKLPKRLSLFKSNDKPAKFNLGRPKTKSLANINISEDMENSLSSDSDCQNQRYIPPDDVYNQVTRDLNWVRVEDTSNENDNFRLIYNLRDTQESDHEKVELFSVQPDNGPITGNFTVVMEGSNFTSGLFDLTYICIDGLEPIDATTCTSILSDTELVLEMPPVPIPGMVNIHLELLDGSRISCSKTFHYIDSVDDLQYSVLTPRTFDNKENGTIADKIFNHFEDPMSLSISDFKNFKSEASIVAKTDNGIESLNKYDRRKLSDYGSQGSFRSDRTSSIRKKIKKNNATKLQLFEENEKLRKDIEDLEQRLRDCESSTTFQITTLTCQLENRDSEIQTISQKLYKLQMQLLEDGVTKYLELP